MTVLDLLKLLNKNDIGMDRPASIIAIHNNVYIWIKSMLKENWQENRKLG